MISLHILIGILAVIVLFDTIIRIWHAKQYREHSGKTYEANQKSVNEFRSMYNEAMKGGLELITKSINEYLDKTKEVIEKYYEMENKND